MPIISPKIPTGLEELMRGLAKSVIKENPQNIYEFAAEYFENLLRERDGSVDQSYKKFATYKVYKKNKNARLKREKENSHDVNDGNSDNGCKKDESTASLEKRQKRDVQGVEQSVEGFILPAAAQPLQALVKAQTSVSSESEFHASIKKESSVDIEGAPSPTGKSQDDDDDIANMVLDSDMEEAALKIQSTFRGHKTRKEVKSKLAFAEEINEQVGAKEDEPSDAEIKTTSESEREREDNEIVEVLQNNEADASEGSGNEKQIENNEPIDKQEAIQSEVDDDVANMVLDEEMEQAALKIQSTFRGHKTRVEMKKEASQSGGQSAADGSQEGQGDVQPEADDDDVANMVLDEEMEMAALKIQSSFRGHKVRQEMKDNLAVTSTENAEQVELNEETVENFSQEVLEGQKLLSEEIIEDEIKPETVSETMASTEKENSEVETVVEGEPLEECEETPTEEIVSEVPADDDLLDTPVDGVEDAELKEVEQESSGIENEENIPESPMVEGEALEAIESASEIPEETLEKLESLEVLTTNPESDSEEAELVKEIEAALTSDEPLVENAMGSLSEPADVTEAELEAESLAPQAVEVGQEEEEASCEKVEGTGDVELVPQESLKLDDESPVALEETIAEPATADVADGDEIIEQSSFEKSLNEDVEQDGKSAENLSDDKATGDLLGEDEKVSEQPEEIKQSVDADDQPALEGEVSAEGGEMAADDENKLQKDLSTVAEAIETSPSQEATENQSESGEVIELTEKSEINIDDEQTEEKATQLSVEQPQDDVTAPTESSENNDQEPPSTLNELPNEIETVQPEEAADDSDYIDSTPVVEDVCERKFIGDLVDDQIVESEIAVKGSLGGTDQENNEGEESPEIIENLPSGEIEYSTLKESLSEHELTPVESLDEVDNKSRDLTDEKSLDGDSKSSKQPSVDEECAEMQSEEPLPAKEKSIEGLIRSSTVDDAETTATQEAERVDENANEAKAVDSILNAEISPIELMDEVINERAGAVANELFNVEHLGDESECEKSPEGNQSTEFIEPKLSEENPLKEIEPSKSINLSQESVQLLQDEQNPINDEILQPDIDDSEIPEETQVPVDENIPTVSLEAENSSVTAVEQLPEDSDREPQKNDDEDDDIANMVLDEEMEDAALKIQAAFRGHKVRKDAPPPPTEAQENESDEAGTENPETTVVIDQCTDEGQTDEQQEETEAQDTSVDVEEIQESEEQEQATEETHDEENAEEETAVDSAENETAEQTEDDPEGTPEGGETSEQPQNDDDDDVANMVLDEEMEQAALKIQSTFRGHKSRTDMKKDGTEGGETSTPDEPPKDSVQEVDDDVAKLTLDDKEGEEAKKEESEPAQSSSEEKTAKQMQDEEDIANIVMDAEMEQTALKIQSAFRGKLGRKKPKDDGDSTGTTEYEDETEDETTAKSEDDLFQPNEMSQEHETGGEKFDDEKASDYSGAAHYTQSGEAGHSVDRYDGSVDFYEPMAGNTSTDDINLMQGGGIFPEASGESSDTLLSSKKNSAEMMTGSSGEDREPDRHSSYEKVPSDKSFEIDETISQKKSVDQLHDEQAIIENFDFDANKDTAEAMYYALKKNEIEQPRQLSDKQPSVEGERTDEEQRLSLETTENQSMDYEQPESDDDDDDCVVIAANSAKRLKYGMSMDDRLLGSILSQDYPTKARRDVFPDDGFDPLLEASMRNQHFLEKLHEMSNSDEGKEMPYDDYPGEDEDNFDDFYRSSNIRQKIMASSISIADSDYFDPTNNKSSIIDENIRTALETIHSTDSESTTITKIQAGERVVGRRANNITTQSMQYASFGNAAIDRSLDEFIQSQELRIDRFDEEAEGFSSPPPRMQESVDEWTDDTTTYTDSDKKAAGVGGVIGIKLEQKPSFLTVDERRRTLHREDAIQRNSTREDEDSSKSSNVSGEKLLDKENVRPVEAASVPQNSVADGDVEIPVPDLTAKSQPSSQSIAKPHRMKRQHTMPVQIQTDVIRVIPKHLRKRIKSAESTDKKKRAPK